MPNAATRSKAVWGWELRTGQTKWREKGLRAAGSWTASTISGWHLRASCLQGRQRGGAGQGGEQATGGATCSVHCCSGSYSRSLFIYPMAWRLSNVLWQLRGALDNGHPQNWAENRDRKQPRVWVPRSTKVALDDGVYPALKINEVTPSAGKWMKLGQIDHMKWIKPVSERKLLYISFSHVAPRFHIDTWSLCA